MRRVFNLGQSTFKLVVPVWAKVSIKPF